MQVIDRFPDGTPRTVELTEAECLVHAIHGNLMDLGHDQGKALVMLRGSATPEGLQVESPCLDAALADVEFVGWLVH